MRLGITDAVKHLLIINVVMFIGTMAIGNGQLFYDWFAFYFPKNPMFQPWQILTHMFMHGDTSHLFFNMLMLYLTGVFVESVLGMRKFLLLYFTSGFGALLLTFVVNYFQFTFAFNDLLAAGFSENQIFEVLNSGVLRYNLQWESVLSEKGLKHLVVNYSTPMVGASGAIMGVLAVLGLLIPNREVFLIFPPIRLKIKYLVVGMIGSDFISALLTGTPLLGHSNTAYWAHVGGAITGALIFFYWKRKDINKTRWN
ncbi:rhomboid family intramembrane serine protease [Winogradskyella sp.]|uniref:rhomboid family intramembrane serine protease n=1 Tax=Winogradskyella sp. TaxID=1883156 RepID=UPI00261399CE|nr:rhomboid family intramembrane serine protease [Winogradskyella sp.]